jgi:integrase
VAHEYLEAASTLQRRASGDWGTDKHEAELAPSQPLAALRTTATGLFEQYIAEKKTKPSTIARWRCVFDALDREQWQALGWDAQRWADSLIGADRGAKGVRDTWIAAPRAVWKWAMRKRFVSSNPFLGVTVDVPRRVQVREAGKTFADAEARTILRTALQTQYSPEVPLTAAKRWAAWLCAHTGARVGEITQLRACDIEERACGPVLRITPEAGTVKTGRARTVPIHEHLVEQGKAGTASEKSPVSDWSQMGLSGTCGPSGARSNKRVTSAC